MKKLFLSLLMCVSCITKVDCTTDDNQDQKQKYMNWYHTEYIKADKEAQSLFKKFIMTCNNYNQKILDAIQENNVELFTQLAGNHLDESLHLLALLGKDASTIFPGPIGQEEEIYLREIWNSLEQTPGETVYEKCNKCLNDNECREKLIKLKKYCITNGESLLQTIEEQEALEQQ
jgi:hypothetical protein